MSRPRSSSITLLAALLTDGVHSLVVIPSPLAYGAKQGLGATPFIFFENYGRYGARFIKGEGGGGGTIGGTGRSGSGSISGNTCVVDKLLSI